MAENKSRIKYLINIIRVLLLALTFVFIFYKIFYAYHISELISGFRWELTTRKCIILLAVPILTCLNWFCESLKWKLLISKKEEFSSRDAIKAVLSGVALGIITPNQLGDFAGRVMHLKKYSKLKGSLITVIGHSAQMMMTIASGMAALLLISKSQNWIGKEEFNRRSYFGRN